MNGRISKYVIATVIISILLLFTRYESRVMQRPGLGSVQHKADIAEPQNAEYLKGGVDEEKEVPETSLSSKTSSGQVTSTPWEDSPDFLKAKEKYGTPVLMAAYRTVLLDPLPGEEYNVHLAARYLAGKVIYPGGIFSQNREIGPYSKARGFREGPTYVGTKLKTTVGGGVCKIASTLYNVAVLCDLKIIERHPHSMPVPYVPYGQDATVSYGARDFKFKNDTDAPILIWAQGVDNVLYIGFYSKRAAPKVKWHHELIERQEAPTYYRKNSSLPRGAKKVVVEGMDGAKVRSWVTVAKADGTVITKELGISSYMPLPYIIETGP